MRAWARLPRRVLVQLGDVRLGGRLADIEVLGDAGDAHAVRQQLQHLAFAGDSCGPVGASRRFIASARSDAVKAVGAEAACRAAATTSSEGAFLGTNALAPASRAPNSCSSPAYMVRTTMPTDGIAERSLRSRRGHFRRQSQIHDDHVRPGVVGLSECLGDRTRLSHDPELRVTLKSVPQTLPDQLMVIDE